MTRMTQQEVDEYMSKLMTSGTVAIKILGRDELYDEGPESKLQSKIVQWAKDWGHPILSFRQSKQVKGIIPPGWPDICLILHARRVVFIELKSQKGRLSPEQKMMRLQFMSHGHEIYEVRSYKAFLKVVNPKTEIEIKKI